MCFMVYLTCVLIFKKTPLPFIAARELFKIFWISRITVAEYFEQH